jgi:hypothetical protein
MTPRNWYEDIAPEEGEHPVSAEAVRIVGHTAEGRALAQRLHTARKRFGASLTAAQAPLYRDFIDALTSRYLLLHAAHYNLGVEVGYAQRVMDGALAGAAVEDADPTAAIQALATELVRLAERLRRAP